MNDLIAISAFVGDRSYRVKINPEDEEVVRKTLKTINDKLVDFKTRFAGRDMQDYIAMVLLWYTTEDHAAAEQGIQEDAIQEQLNNIEKLLDIRVSSSDT